LCINLRDDEIRELGKKGFPAYPQCFNYLAGNIDNARSGGVDEPRADWQHSESQSQSQIRPHLSRYNRNVLASINPVITQILLYWDSSLLLLFSMCTDNECTRKNNFLIFNSNEKSFKVYIFSFPFVTMKTQTINLKNDFLTFSPSRKQFSGFLC
jgi:hypothetical protein